MKRGYTVYHSSGDPYVKGDRVPRYDLQVQRPTRSYIPKKVGQGYFRPARGPRPAYRKARGGEKKVVDVNSGYIVLRNAASISTAVDNVQAQATHQVWCLNASAEGATYTDHLGRRQCNQSLWVNLYFMPNTTVSLADEQGDSVRVIIFWDFQCNGGTTFTLSNLLQDTGATPVTDTLAPINLNNRERFRILLDKKITLEAFCLNGSSILTGGSPKFHILKKYINLKGVETTYNTDASSGAYGEIQTGALMMAVFSQFDQNYLFKGQSRVRFTDP